MNIERVQTLLTWLGLIPFVFFAMIFLFGSWDSLITPGYAIVSYAIYAAVILSFMAGTHWGLAMAGKLPAAVSTLLWSNTVALIAWIGVAMQFKVVGLCLVLVGFLVQLWLDASFSRAGVITRQYFRLRQLITAGVVVTLIPVILRLAEVI